VTRPTTPRALRVPDSLQRVMRGRAGEWTPVPDGCSGAQVWRSTRGTPLIAKIVADDGSLAADQLVAELAAEAERAEWLRGKGFPAPAVIELRREGPSAQLIMTALPGRTLAEPWPSAMRERLVSGVAAFTRDLHRLPVADCPFRRDLTVTVPEAIAAAESGLVDADDFDDERSGLAVREVLQELLCTRPATEDLVVCHGDLCLPNVLADSDSGEITGVVDLGRLGVADRHQDLALATRSLGPTNNQYGPSAARWFLDAYGGDVDPARLEFYRLLDEFF
jgi:kanamycin kinase/aminoglycoside 3'-phosphotransferase-2